MAVRVVTVTRKGQVTIPVEMREALGITVGDMVSISLVDGAVRIVPSESVARRTAGVLKPQGGRGPEDKGRQATEEAIAEETIRRMSTLK